MYRITRSLESLVRPPISEISNEGIGGKQRPHVTYSQYSIMDHHERENGYGKR